MSRIKKAFKKRKKQGGKLFIPYLCAGDPDLKISLELLFEAERAGADLIEVGIPFSDPTADGPTIQSAILRSLNGGTKLKDMFELVSRFREKSEVPVVMMTYYNPILRYGEEKFVEAARRAGVDGLLVVDLSPEEGLDFFKLEEEKGLESVLLAAPPTSLERVSELSKIAGGFIYYVLVKGVTGVRDGYDAGLARRLGEVVSASEKPVVVGFGVSSYEKVKDYVEAIDGVVVGSALAKEIEANPGDREAILKKVGEKMVSLARPLHGEGD
ncbi:MAG: tryptophan synthase subunit alpha [bacterium]